MTRVSSAPIRSTLASTSSARSVTSRRLPSGVATTYNVPARAALFPPARGSDRAGHRLLPSACVRRAHDRSPRRSIVGVPVALVAAFCAAQAPATSDVRAAAVPARPPRGVPRRRRTPPPRRCRACRDAAPPGTADRARAAARIARLRARGRGGARRLPRRRRGRGRARRVRVIGHGDDDVLTAFDEARDARRARRRRTAGARRPADAGRRRPRRCRSRIALNQLDDGAPLPPPRLHVRARDRKRRAHDRAAHARRERAERRRSSAATRR